ncbi:crotonase/enoyl-CoA hydratase family protein [Pseudomonas tolaasii]|uniref:crotonase/enoyl-CoA hydratase family protein n=1 Tax=Pseudomonas tolaasii TaxID=29442 RepID=UPI002735B7CD|nr:crotonase/enoyl-CoA hydratase family protein [Pseudomonas tolaasii]WLH54049.1 crotonase/enoyl-CoA hydratase family protein [Pseudomonas tolaasii]
MQRLFRTALLFSALSLSTGLAFAQSVGDAKSPSDAVTMVDIPTSAAHKITVERRGQIVLIGINRTAIQNRLDPQAYLALAKAYYDYDHDPSLRAAVLFGHGDNFSQGLDVEGFKAAATSGGVTLGDGFIDPLGKKMPFLTKPLIVAVQGDTWNMAHELFLVADIRVAAKNTNFGQDENTHGRYPGGGSTVRFVREAGWGNAMRYILTGDHWSAQEAYRMGEVQAIAGPKSALDAAIKIANKIAANGPLGIKASLASAHRVIDPAQADALSGLDVQRAALYKSNDFQEGRKAEAEGRPPVYQGN